MHCIPDHYAQTKTSKTETQPAAMHKTQLARLYAPGLTASGARNRLRDWLQQTRGLMEALQRTGYRPDQRVLTKRQVEIVFSFLGEP